LCGGLSSQQKTAASEAVKSLEKLKASAQIGVNKSEYRRLVVDGATVNQALSKLPDGELKTN
jgi:hypothetical protein